MRIIGGTHKGRVLKTFKGTEIRPTSDRARQAFFNIFAEKIIGASFLDGFAGTGAMGIEAISRGAKRVVFTDLKRASIELINQNLNMIKESATVMVCDLLSYLKTTPERFDFIFLDPPYMTDLGQRALEIIDKRKLLNEGGQAIFESHEKHESDYENLVFISCRDYGKNHFSIYGLKD